MYDVRSGVLKIYVEQGSFASRIQNFNKVHPGLFDARQRAAPHFNNKKSILRTSRGVRYTSHFSLLTSEIAAYATHLTSHFSLLTSEIAAYATHLTSHLSLLTSHF